MNQIQPNPDNPFLKITIQDLAQTAGLLDKLGEPGQYTLFAPTNEAFDSLGSDVLERIQSDKEALKGKPDLQS